MVVAVEDAELIGVVFVEVALPGERPIRTHTADGRQYAHMARPERRGHRRAWAADPERHARQDRRRAEHCDQPTRARGSCFGAARWESVQERRHRGPRALLLPRLHELRTAPSQVLAYPLAHAPELAL